MIADTREGRPLFGKKRVSEDPVVNLARCITICDGLRAYRRNDIAEADGTFDALKKTRFAEHSDMWTRVRPSAERIVNMPMRVKGAPRMIGAVNWTKVVGRLALIVLIILIAVQIVPIWQNALGTEPLGGAILLPTLGVLLSAVVMLTVSSVLDYSVRKRIIAYEDATDKEYASDRKRMKECVNTMMRSLARETERGKETPESLAMVLNFGDYDNVEVVGERKAKVMLVGKATRTLFLLNPKMQR